jgi:hypothetical protein
MAVPLQLFCLIVRFWHSVIPLLSAREARTFGSPSPSPPTTHMLRSFHHLSPNRTAALKGREDISKDGYSSGIGDNHDSDFLYWTGDVGQHVLGTKRWSEGGTLSRMKYIRCFLYLWGTSSRLEEG